jgi:hypothetical protein
MVNPGFVYRLGPAIRRPGITEGDGGPVMEILPRKGAKEVDAVRTRASGIGLLLGKLLMVAGLLGAASCAQSTHSVKADEAANVPPTLQEIRVSGDGDDTRIEIVGNKKLKYTLYNIDAPPRGVIDFPVTEAPLVRTTVPRDSSLVTQIDIVKNETDGQTAARVIVKLARPVNFTAIADPTNEKMVVLTVKKTQARRVAASDGKNARSVRTPASTSTKKTRNRPASGRAKTASLAKPTPAVSSDNSMTLEDVNITSDGIEFDIKGVNDNFTYFKIKNPQRLVIDIFGADLGVVARQIAVNRFGIKSVRLGRHPDKVRIVFDPSRNLFPYCRIEVNKSTVKVLFKKEEREGAETSGG